MKRRLPAYIVKCLEAAGYDELNTIAKMDITDNPGNSISKTEQYIERRFSGNSEYFSNSSMQSSPFEFPPGHRDRICHFVHEVRALASKPTNKRKRDCTSEDKAKRLKVEVSLDSISKQVRDTIARWVQQQTEPTLKQSTENQHYKLIVSTEDSFSVSVMCLVCKKTITLHQRNSSNKCGPYIISNWTRHVKKCYSATNTTRATTTISTQHQLKLDQYLASGKVPQQHLSSNATDGTIIDSPGSHPHAQSTSIDPSKSSLDCASAHVSNSDQVFRIAPPSM